jgi:hypothetical protein
MNRKNFSRPCEKVTWKLKQKVRSGFYCIESVLIIVGSLQLRIKGLERIIKKSKVCLPHVISERWFYVLSESSESMWGGSIYWLNYLNGWVINIIHIRGIYSESNQKEKFNLSFQDIGWWDNSWFLRESSFS